MEIIKVNSQNFEEEVLKSEKPVLVDFYADWCGPCKMLGPVLESMDANILKINVDSHEDLATRFGVMSIPTICFFKDGELKERVVGFRNKDELESILKGI